MPDTISVVEAIWNLPASWLDYNLCTLSNQTMPPLEVVVTNASSNLALFDAVTGVCAKYPLVKMVEHKQDVFNFARCQNVAIQATQGKYVMVTCIDKLFSKRFMEEVYRLVAPRTMVTSDSSQLPIGLDLGDVNTLMDRWDSIFAHRFISNVSATGTIMATERDWLFKIRGFDEVNHAFNFNDSDLMLRAVQDGFGPFVATNGDIGQVLHIGHPSTLYNSWGGSYPDANRPIIRNPGRWGNICS